MVVLPRLMTAACQADEPPVGFVQKKRGDDMDIFVNRLFSSRDQKKEEPPRRGRRKKRRERRRSGRDRRKAVNEGVVVSLSIKNDRRSHRERRRHSGEVEFHLPEKREKGKKRSFSVLV